MAFKRFAGSTSHTCDEFVGHPGEKVLAKLFELANQDDCFDKLDELLDDEEYAFLRPDFFRWSILFALDALQEWLLREGSWCGDSFQAGFPDGIHFVQEILRRRLTCLETRINPSKLNELWEWVADQAGVDEKIRTIWDRRQVELQNTLVRSDPLTIPTQEERFAEILRATADDLAGDDVACVKLEWAVQALRDLAQERCPRTRPVRRASARVVFAWIDQERTICRRPGIFIPFEFRQKFVGLGADKTDWFVPKQWFAVEFIKAMSELIQAQGDCYPMSVVQDRLPAFPPRVLCGSSGKLAVAIAQRLANVSSRGTAPCAVPPWLAVVATARAVGDGMASSVDFLRQKLLVLREEGVRVVAVADTQLELSGLKAEFPEIYFVELKGTADEGANSLRNWGYTWEADLRALNPKFTLRHIAVLAVLAVSTGFLGLYFGKYLPHIHNVSPTRAMELSWDRRPQLAKLWTDCNNVKGDFAQEVRDIPENSTLTRLNALCRLVYTQHGLPSSSIRVLAPGKRPPEANHPAVGLETLAKHTAFDYSEWRPLQYISQIEKEPLEVCYATSVYQFRKRKAGALRVALELNTSGFGVVPLLEPGDELILGTRPMDEAGRITKTSFVVRTIPAEWPDTFELTVHSLYINGLQNHHLRHDPEEWSAIRVNPGVKLASLAIVKPRVRTIRSIRRVERIETAEDIDLGEPATFSRAAGERIPEQDWYVWPIDTDGQLQSTVYSMRWKLK